MKITLLAWSECMTQHGWSRSISDYRTWIDRGSFEIILPSINSIPLELYVSVPLYPPYPRGVNAHALMRDK